MPVIGCRRHRPAPAGIVLVPSLSAGNAAPLWVLAGCGGENGRVESLTLGDWRPADFLGCGATQGDCGGVGGPVSRGRIDDVHGERAAVLRLPSGLVFCLVATPPDVPGFSLLCGDPERRRIGRGLGCRFWPRRRLSGPLSSGSPRMCRSRASGLRLRAGLAGRYGPARGSMIPKWLMPLSKGRGPCCSTAGVAGRPDVRGAWWCYGMLLGGSRRVIRSNSSVSGSPTSRPNSVSP